MTKSAFVGVSSVVIVQLYGKYLSEEVNNGIVNKRKMNSVSHFLNWLTAHANLYPTSRVFVHPDKQSHPHFEASTHKKPFSLPQILNSRHYLIIILTATSLIMVGSLLFSSQSVILKPINHKYISNDYFVINFNPLTVKSIFADSKDATIRLINYADAKSVEPKLICNLSFKEGDLLYSSLSVPMTSCGSIPSTFEGFLKVEINGLHIQDFEIQPSGAIPLRIGGLDYPKLINGVEGRSSTESDTLTELDLFSPYSDENVVSTPSSTLFR